MAFELDKMQKRAATLGNRAPPLHGLFNLAGQLRVSEGYESVHGEEIDVSLSHTQY